MDDEIIMAYLEKRAPVDVTSLTPDLIEALIRGLVHRGAQVARVLLIMWHPYFQVAYSLFFNEHMRRVTPIRIPIVVERKRKDISENILYVIENKFFFEIEE